MANTNFTICTLVLTMIGAPTATFARTAEELHRDAAAIRQLNRDQIDHVRRRDAGYAQQWEEYSRYKKGAPRPDQAARAADRDYEADLAAYREERRRYEQEMAQWRDTVAACRAGEYDRC